MLTDYGTISATPFSLILCFFFCWCPPSRRWFSLLFLFPPCRRSTLSAVTFSIRRFQSGEVVRPTPLSLPGPQCSSPNKQQRLKPNRPRNCSFLANPPLPPHLKTTSTTSLSSPRRIASAEPRSGSTLTLSLLTTIRFVLCRLPVSCSSKTTTTALPRLLLRRISFRGRTLR